MWVVFGEARTAMLINSEYTVNLIKDFALLFIEKVRGKFYFFNLRLKS